MKAAKGKPAFDQIVTGNRLSDGAVVFFGRDGGWSENIADARVVAKADGDALIAQAEAAAGAVVAPYLIDVEPGPAGAADRPVPTRYRERIRAFGPSIHPQFAK